MEISEAFTKSCLVICFYVYTTPRHVTSPHILTEILEYREYLAYLATVEKIFPKLRLVSDASRFKDMLRILAIKLAYRCPVPPTGQESFQVRNNENLQLHITYSFIKIKFDNFYLDIAGQAFLEKICHGADFTENILEVLEKWQALCTLKLGKRGDLQPWIGLCQKCYKVQLAK